MNWGPWQTEGIPELGDYIQAEGHLRLTREPVKSRELVHGGD